LALLEENPSGYLLAHSIVGDSEYLNLEHLRMGVYELFHFLRINVFSSSNYGVLETANYGGVATG
jgi:hypothetical protein